MRDPAQSVHPGGPTWNALFDLTSGRLQPETQEWLTAHLKTCAECQTAVAGLEVTRAELEAPAERPFERQQILTRVRREIAELEPARSGRRLQLVFGLAAVVLIAVGVWTQRERFGSSIAVQIFQRSGDAQPLAMLELGQSLNVPPSGGVAASWGGTLLRVEGGKTGAQVRLMKSSARERRIWLEHGSVVLDVAPLGPKASLIVETPDGEVRVHGTRFEVSRSEAGTSVSVTRGLVRVKRSNGEVDVPAGQLLLPGAPGVSALPKNDGDALDALLELGLPDESVLGWGTLEVQANAAAAEVMIDGKPRGFAPLSVRVAAGDHSVQVRAPGHAPFAASQSVAKGATAVVRAQLEGEALADAEADVLKLARNALAEGRYAQAIEELARLRKELSAGALRDQATVLQGQALRLSGAAGEAATLFEEVASRGDGPQSEQALFLLAQTYGRDLARPARAAQLWESYRQRFASGIFYEEASFRGGEALLSAGRADAGLLALDGYLRAYAHGPHADEAHLLIAAAKMKKGQWREALTDVRAVSSGRAQLSEEALIREARCLQALSRSAEARQKYRAYLERWPGGEFASEARKQLRALSRQ